MLISLFITCYNDTLFPETGKAVVARARAARPSRSSSARRRPAAGRCTTTPATPRDALPLMRALPRRLRRRRGHLRSVGVLRRDDPRSLSEDGGRVAATRRCVARGRRAPAARVRVHRAARRQARRHRRRRVVSAHASRCTRPATRSARCTSATSRARLLRAVRGLELVDLPGRRRVLRLRRHVRGEERRRVERRWWPTRSRCVLETGAEVCTAADNSCLMQIGGALQPAAAPGVRCLHLAEILAPVRPH